MNLRSLPQAAMPAIYKTAREAGLDPTRACCIDNRCFDSEADEQMSTSRPLFTPVAQAGTLGAIPESSQSSNTAAELHFGLRKRLCRLAFQGKHPEISVIAEHGN